MSVKQLGILDLCDLKTPSASLALQQTLELAKLADQLGYSRYWFAEHHTGFMATPEILVPLVASQTEQIRVGTGGILFRYYNPLKVAETFRLLEALFPDRIDLGLAAGTGGGEKIVEALLSPHAKAFDPSKYAEQFEDLLYYLHGGQPEGHPFQGIQAAPLDEQLGAPEVWALGTRSGSAELAAQFGTQFSFSLFLKPLIERRSEIKKILNRYLDEFQPGFTLAKPQFSIAVAGICAETEGEAKKQIALHDNSFIVPTILGTPAQVREQLEEWSAELGADEIMFHHAGQNFEVQSRSYRLLAEAFGLNV